MGDIRTPFITAALNRRDNPDTSRRAVSGARAELSGYWLTPHEEDDKDD